MENEENETDEFAREVVDALNQSVTRDNRMFHAIVRDAIQLALQTREIDQKQKRKGKDIPYIVHPLTVGLILARAGAEDAMIAAGILHDVIEDSVPEKKVTATMLRERFTPYIVDIVEDVTEYNKTLTWSERKSQALKHIETMEGPSLWVKTADVISNVSELVDDYAKDQDQVFERFNASKADVIANYRAVINALLERWGTKSGNPMTSDLHTLADDLKEIA